MLMHFVYCLQPGIVAQGSAWQAQWPRQACSNTMPDLVQAHLDVAWGHSPWCWASLGWGRLALHVAAALIRHAAAHREADTPAGPQSVADLLTEAWMSRVKAAERKQPAVPL